MPTMSSMVLARPWVATKRAFVSGRKNAVTISVGLIVLLILTNILFPTFVSADVDTGPHYPDDETVALRIDAMLNESRAFGELPESAKAEPKQVLKIPITAYTSDVAQTDSTPCIAARGFDLCKHNEEDVIAANFLPMGAKIRIPELYGDRVFTVVDRMNARYTYRVDIWMREYDDARAFGIKYTTVEVL